MYLYVWAISARRHFAPRHFAPKDKMPQDKMPQGHFAPTCVKIVDILPQDILPQLFFLHISLAYLDLLLLLTCFSILLLNKRKAMFSNLGKPVRDISALLCSRFHRRLNDEDSH